MFTRFLLLALALVAVAVWGYLAPQTLGGTLDAADGGLEWVADNLDNEGYLALILKFTGGGFALLLAGIMLATGVTVRAFAAHLLRWRRLLGAVLIPLAAHGVTWVLGYYNPSLLLLLQEGARWLISQTPTDVQVSALLINGPALVITIIVAFGLMMIWSILTFVLRRLRRRRISVAVTPPPPHAPLDNRSDMKNLLKWGWLVTLPFRLLRRAIKWPFTHDIVLGPITWFIFQVGLGVGLGYVLTEGVEWGLTAPLNLLHGWIWILFSIIFCLPRWKQVDGVWRLDIFKVTGAGRGAQLTWLGMVTPFILKTGTYPYLGERFGFAWLKVESTTIAENGFLILGDITFPVWQSPNAEEKSKGRTTITLQAGNGGTVSGNLAFVIRGRRRIRWEIAGDAGLQLGNRGRQELQEIIERFTDTDVRSLQPVMSRLFKGEMMVTCMMPDDVVGRKARSIIRDVNNKPIYVFVGDTIEEGDQTILLSTKEEAEDYLRRQIALYGDKKSRDALTKDANGKFITTFIKADHPVEEVVKFLGHDLGDVTYDSVLNSEEVETAANLASAEERQRDIQLASARTAAEGARVLQLTENERIKLTAAEQANLLENQRIKLAIDSPNSNVKFVHVAGELTQRLKDLIAAEHIKEGGSK